MRYKFLWILFFICTSLSCNKQNEVFQRIVNEWQNKEIVFVDSLCSKIYGRDTLLSPISLGNTYKILSYIDTSDCIECKLKFQEWNRLIKESDSLHLKVDFVFVANLNHYYLLEKSQKINKFDRAIYYDYKDLINKKNKFPKNFMFQTFLLNSQNSVVLVGNPAINPKLWDLYKREIPKEKEIKR